MISTTARGEIGLHSVAADLIGQGYSVLFPMGGNPHYDLVIERKGIFWRVQVKYAKPKKGSLSVRFFTVGHDGRSNFHTADTTDIVSLYDSDSKQIYYLNRREFTNTSTVTLRLEPPKNNYLTGVKFARDFKKLQV